MGVELGVGSPPGFPSDGVGDSAVDKGVLVGVELGVGSPPGFSSDGVGDPVVDMGALAGLELGVAEGAQATQKIAASRTIGPTIKYHFMFMPFMDIT